MDGPETSSFHTALGQNMVMSEKQFGASTELQSSCLAVMGKHAQPSGQENPRAA
jgi:hypothetical protein